MTSRAILLKEISEDKEISFLSVIHPHTSALASFLLLLLAEFLPVLASGGGGFLANSFMTGPDVGRETCENS